MKDALTRGFLALVFAIAGCAVTGDAPSGSESPSSQDSQEAATQIEQGLTTSCALQCQEAKWVCQASCPKDPFNPQNDCGCGAAFDLCKARCAVGG